MSFKIFLLVGVLVTAVFAQDITDLGDFSGDSSELSSEASTAMRVQANFDASISSETRLNNFFCLDRTSTYNATSRQVNVTYTQYEQTSSNVWTLYVQMPILGYLDVTRKRALIDIVVNVLGGGISPRSLNDVCIGTYEIYGISTFSESILIHLYSRTSTPFTVSDIITTFETNVNNAYNDASNTTVIGYPGQGNLITFNLTASSEYSGEVLYRGDTSSDGAVPINLAVYLGSYANNLTFGTPVSGVSEAFGNRATRPRASNPNPINYGLEPGDIVFAIIGSILLVIVTFVIFLGYCIHPFFLA